MKYLFLLFIGISSLVGCAAEEKSRYVEVIRTYQSKPQKPVCAVWKQTCHIGLTGSLACLKDYPELCSRFYTVGTGTTIETDYLSPEEFTFRYQNDQAFKDSIQSYQFSQ